MPLFDFECQQCGVVFEELVRNRETVVCPACGAAEPRRLLSQVSPAGRFEVRGAAAKRSNAVRADREAVKREQFSAKRKRTRG